MYCNCLQAYEHHSLSLKTTNVQTVMKRDPRPAR